jgi:RND family efflux transporter MFP subunit
VLQAQARLKQAEADVKRNEPLVRTGATTQADFEKLVADRDVAAAQVESAKAAVESARLNVDFCRITAPFGGRISRRYVDPGNLVQADNTVLTSIVTLDPVYATFDVDERTLLRLRRLIREGKIPSARETEVPVWLALADEPDFSRQGVINFADNKVDPATGTLRVRAVFRNEDRLLSPGLFVRVRARVGVPHRALLVAEQALGTDQGQKFVYVVNANDEIEYRTVRVGPLHDGLRVIEAGLKPDERVVVRGLQRVRPGGPRVRPRLVPMPNGAATSSPQTTAKAAAGQ